MNNWFSSDFHLGHEIILRKSILRKERFKNIKEHDEGIIEILFEHLKPGDNFYFLGDLFFRYSTEQKTEFFNKFKKHRVNFHWIMGNHDRPFKHHAIVFLGQIKDIKIAKHKITLCHYPMYVWKDSCHGAWQLFGHIHNNDATDVIFPYNKLGKQLNVNVELWKFTPLEFEYIKEIMDFKKDNFDLIKGK